MGTRRYGQTLWPLLVFVLAACSNGSGSLDSEAPPPSSGAQTGLTIGGTVVGLSGGSVSLQNNGAGDLQVAADGAFTFAGTASSGAAYDVKVSSQPAAPPQTCTVANGAGTVASANVTNIVVTCSTAPRFTIRVTVSGLAGSGLVLQNNATDSLPIPSNGNYLFATALTTGSAYSVTVGTQPNGQNCVVRNATGTIASANVTNVEVACVANQFSVGGRVSGLRGSGLVLQLNGANDLPIVNDGPFAFPVALANTAAYTVSVKTGAQPKTPNQDCALAKNVGTINGANVIDVAVTCTTRTFTVGGSVAGLVGTGLVLTINGGNETAIAANGTFAFSQPLPSGTAYKVRVTGEPSTGVAQSCSVAQDAGTVTDANITNVAVTCATKSYAVGGTLLGLVGQGLQLLNNLGDPLNVTANGPFVFPAKVASGAAYSVTVGTYPSNPLQGCSLSREKGTVTDRAIDNVVVNCTTRSFPVGGTVTGLAGSGLELANNNDRLPVNANGPFSFQTAAPSGSTFNVSVTRQPTGPNQTCSLVGTSGVGTVVDAEIKSIAVNCVNDGYVVRARVSGMRGDALVLRNNGVETISVTTDGVFPFPTPVPALSTYSVDVLTQPNSPELPVFCFVALPSAGTVFDRDVEVAVNCF